MTRSLPAALCLAVAFVLAGCAPPAIEEASRAGTGSTGTELPGQVIDLPDPRLQSDTSLEEVLNGRRSVRTYSKGPLTIEEIAQLFWAAQGVTHQQGYRTAPSAGALYPLELYAGTEDGLYHYQPQGHRALIRQVDGWRPALCQAALKQEAVCQASAVFVVSAVYERTAKKYGERAERYVRLEAGHAAQNLLLQAVALDLGAVPIGAFYDDQVQAALGLPAEQQPLYLIPVGR